MCCYRQRTFHVLLLTPSIDTADMSSETLTREHTVTEGEGLQIPCFSSLATQTLQILIKHTINSQSLPAISSRSTEQEK